jgi:hypothetical protein
MMLPLNRFHIHTYSDMSSVVHAITFIQGLCISDPMESVWCNFTKQQFGVGMQGQVNLLTSREMLLSCNCAPKLTQ